MQVLHQLGGIPLRAAYSIIKAISKKKQETIQSARADFVRGSGAQGLSAVKAQELFDLILKFAGYGFNKSHSTGYAIIAYQTAYLKTYFPAQYMAAVLTFESQAQKVEDWAVYLEECKRIPWPDSTNGHRHTGVEVKPPDINLSVTDFSIVFDPDEPQDNLHGHVRFGLRAMKGVGDAAIAAVIEERTRGGAFRDLFDLCSRVSLRAVTKSTIESFIKAGVLDSLHGTAQRASMLASLEEALRAGSAAAQDRAAGQMSMFGGLGAGESSAPNGAGAAVDVAVPLRKVEPWSRLTALQHEREALGFHVSGHPLDEWAGEIRSFCTADSGTLGQQSGSVLIAGLVTRIRQIITQRGSSANQRMAIATLADKGGTFNAVLFAETYAEFGELLQEGSVVVIVGSPDKSRAEPGVIVDRLIPMDAAAAHLANSIEIRLDAERAATSDEDSRRALLGTVRMLAGALRQASGSVANLKGRPVEVRVQLGVDGGSVALLPQGVRVVADRDVLRRLSDIVGPGRVVVRGGYVPPRRERGGRGRFRDTDD